MKINEEINWDSQAIDILKDVNFLKLFKIFILNYETNEISDNLTKLKKQFLDKNYIKNFSSKNNYDLFLQFWKFFSDSFHKNIFISFLKNYNLSEEYLNVFLETWEYLLDIYNKKDDYPKSFYDVWDNYKKEISKIIWKNELKDVSLILLKNWYPNISRNNLPIIEVDFNNFIEFNNPIEKYYWKDNSYKFIYSRDYLNNVFYQNSLGEVLTDFRWKIITYIDTKWIKDFYHHKVFLFKNEDWEKMINIQNSLSLESNYYEIEVEDFNIKRLEYFEDIEWELWEILKNERQVFDYLQIRNKDGEFELYDKNIEKINLLDLFVFLHKNNPIIWNQIKETLSKLSEIEVLEIFNIRNYNWIKFLEVEVEIEEYNEEYDDLEKNLQHLVFLDNWTPLVDNNELWVVYIRSLWEVEDFIWYKFIEFSLIDSLIDWYIDWKWNVVKINWKRLQLLEKLPFKRWNESYYKLNNDSRNIIGETELLKQLNKYESLDNLSSEFEINFDREESFIIDDFNVVKIIWKIKDNWDISFQLFNWYLKKDINKHDLILSLNKNWKNDVLNLVSKIIKNRN